MKLFHKRPLSLILGIILGTFVVFSYLPNLYLYIGVGVCFVILLSVLIFWRSKSRKIFLSVVIISVIISSILSNLYFNKWFYSYGKYSENSTVIGKVLEREDTSYGDKLYLETYTVDGSNASHKIIVYIGINDGNFPSGSVISFTGTIEEFQNNSDYFDTGSYYTSKGITGVVYSAENTELIRTDSTPLIYKIAQYRFSLARKIVSSTDKNAGGLLSALLFGEKSYLSEKTELDFKRIGISHILALSGMHFAILMIAVEIILRRLGLRKRMCMLISLIFSVLYMFLTGFPPTILRAGFMLIISYILRIIIGNYDSVTSLFTALFIIILIQPYSVRDISLWLSFFATLGVIAAIEFMHTDRFKNKAVKYILTSLTTSLFAIMATLAFTVFSFKNISLISILATTIFSIPIQFFIYAGLIHLLIGAIFPTKYIVILLANIISFLSEQLSKFKFIYFSCDFPLISILTFIISILFFIFLIVDIKRKNLCKSLFSASIIFIFVISFIMTQVYRPDSQIVYLKNENNDEMLIYDSNDITLIEAGTANLSSANNLKNLIQKEKITYIDNFILVNYSDYTANYLEEILSFIYIENIYIPKPRLGIENDHLTLTQNMMNEYSTKLKLLEEGSQINLKNFSFTLLYSSLLGHEDNRSLFTVSKGGKDYTYASLGMFETDVRKLTFYAIENSECLIIGNYGYQDYYLNFTYKFDSLEKIVFASEKITVPQSIMEHYNKIYISIKPQEENLIH